MDFTDIMDLSTWRDYSSVHESCGTKWPHHVGSRTPSSEDMDIMDLSRELWDKMTPPCRQPHRIFGGHVYNGLVTRAAGQWPHHVGSRTASSEDTCHESCGTMTLPCRQPRSIFSHELVRIKDVTMLGYFPNCWRSGYRTLQTKLLYTANQKTNNGGSINTKLCNLAGQRTCKFLGIFSLIKISLLKEKRSTGIVKSMGLRSTADERTQMQHVITNTCTTTQTRIKSWLS